MGWFATLFRTKRNTLERYGQMKALDIYLSEEELIREFNEDLDADDLDDFKKDKSKTMTPDQVFHTLTGTGIGDFRGQTNLAWQTLGWGLGAEAKIDFAQFACPCAPVTLELSGNAKGSVARHALIMTHGLRTPGKDMLGEEKCAKYHLESTNVILLACMEGSMKEFSLELGFEGGFKLSKMSPFGTEAAGFGLEAKATARAKVGFAGKGYQICDRSPAYFAKGQLTQLKAEFQGFLSTQKREKNYFTRPTRGISYRSTKQEIQPYNPLCSINYWQSEKTASGGIGAEVSISLGQASGDSVGVQAKAGIGLEAKGSWKAATYRVQLADQKNIVYTQDTIVTYKQVSHKVEGMLGAQIGKVNTHDDDNHPGQMARDNIANVQKEVTHEFESLGKIYCNSLSYRSSVSYWLLGKITPPLDVDQDTAHGKRVPMANALWPAGVLPGSGLQLGVSVSAPTLLAHYKAREDRTALDRGDLEGLADAIVGIAEALRVTRENLVDFLDSMKETFLDTVKNPGARPTAFLLEANFESEESKLARGRMGSGTIDVPAKVQTTRSDFGVDANIGGRAGRFKKFKDMTDHYATGLGGDSKVYKNLQCIRLRYRQGDQEDKSGTKFKLGFKCSAAELGFSLDRIDRVGYEGIFDLGVRWFAPFTKGNDTGEATIYHPVPAAILIT